MRLFSEKARGNPKRLAAELAAELVAGLLVVAVVAMILFPIFQRPSRDGTRYSCLSHIKQLSTAVVIYGMDNEDKFPPYFTFDGKEHALLFMEVTRNYTKGPEIYLCPKDKGPTIDWPEGIEGKMSYVHCLGLKGLIPNFSKGGRELKVKDGDISNSKIPYMRDPIRGYGSTKDSASVGFLGPHPGFVVAFLDGHVRARNPLYTNTEL